MCINVFYVNQLRKENCQEALQACCHMMKDVHWEVAKAVDSSQGKEEGLELLYTFQQIRSARGP
jgi:hypothetical protein